MRRWKKWAALAALLLLPWPAWSQVKEGSTNQYVSSSAPCFWWTGTGWTKCTSHGSAADVFITNPSVTNYVPNAMGPTTHRENNGGAPWVASYARDSTGAIDLKGGTKVALWFNVQPDTCCDSLGVIHWYALGVRMSLTTAVDTTTSSPWMPLLPMNPGGSQFSGPITTAAVVLANAGGTVLHTNAASSSLGLFSSVPIGATITGPGIPAGATVVSKGTSDSAITISAATTVAFAPSAMSFWMPMAPNRFEVGGLLAAAATYQNLPAAGLAVAVNVATALLPGEMLVPFTLTGNGIGGSRYVVLDLGSAIAANYVAFTLRSFGHWSNNPQASFIRNPIFKTKVRTDVVVLK